MTGQELLVAGFFLAMALSQPVAYLLVRWVEHTEAADRVRSRTPDGSTVVDSSSDPQAALSTPWAGVEHPVEVAPPAHTLAGAVAGHSAAPARSLPTPVDVGVPHPATSTGLQLSPSPQTLADACEVTPRPAASAGPTPGWVA